MNRRTVVSLTLLVVLVGATGSVVGAGTTAVEFADADATAETGGSTTIPVVVTDASRGVGAYEFTVSVADTDIAELASVDPAGGPAFVDIDRTGNRSITLTAAGADTSDSGRVVIGRVAVTGVGTGETSLSVSVDALGDERGASYGVNTTSGTTVNVVSGGSGGGGGGGGGDISDQDIAFAVDGTLRSDSVAAGEPLTAVVTVENTDDLGGEYRAELVVDGTTTNASRTVELDPGEERRITLEHSIQSTGVYHVRVGDTRLGTVTVVEEGVRSVSEAQVEGEAATFGSGPVERVGFDRSVTGEVTVERRASVPERVPSPAGTVLVPIVVSAPAGAGEAVSTVRFGLPSDRIASVDAVPGDVRLAYYDESVGRWRTLSTRVVDDGDQRVVFASDATTTGLFAAIVPPSQATGTAAETRSAGSTPNTPEASGGEGGTAAATTDGTEPGGFGVVPLVGVAVLVVGTVIVAFALRARMDG